MKNSLKRVLFMVCLLSLGVFNYSFTPACPAVDGIDPVYFPHESDCGKYYQCSMGEAVELTCPSGLYFNATSNVCDYPSTSGCESGGGSGGAPTCAAGGCHSSSCSYSGTITVMGSGVAVSNSVSCDASTYACCHLTAYCFSKSKCG